MCEVRVWCEEIHQFTTPEAKGWIEGGCYDPDDLRETFLENIYTDIWNYDSRTKTSDEGVAIVKDGDLADICFDNGWDVRHVRTHDKDEDGMMIEWWEIFPAANLQL